VEADYSPLTSACRLRRCVVVSLCCSRNPVTLAPQQPDQRRKYQCCPPTPRYASNIAPAPRRHHIRILQYTKAWQSLATEPSLSPGRRNASNTVRNAVPKTRGGKSPHLRSLKPRKTEYKSRHRAPVEDCDKMAGPCKAACDAVTSDDPVLARLWAGDSE